MFSLYPNPNSYANANPNPAMSDCYIQACRILVISCDQFVAFSTFGVGIGC